MGNTTTTPATDGAVGTDTITTRLTNHVNIWLAVLAIVIGLGSIGATTVISRQTTDHSKREICIEETRQNKQVRDYIAGLVSDPTTPTDVRAKAVAAALVSFPELPASCLPSA